MNTPKMPGFFADRSMNATAHEFRTASPGGTYVSASTVVPQRLICHRDAWGQVICVDPLCRANCYRTKHGAALQACLADC